MKIIPKKEGFCQANYANSLTGSATREDRAVLRRIFTPLSDFSFIPLAFFGGLCYNGTVTI
jgi:hypothetical protein